MSASPIPATRLLAEFAAGLSLDDLPDEVRRLVPVLLVDIFRNAAVGRDMPWVAKAEAALRARGGTPAASIFFGGEPMDAVRAACLNGTIAGSLDWDDSHIAAIIHPGIVIWPAALAAAEQADADGRALVEAVVAGYEVAIRIGMAGQPDHTLRGFQGTPTCGTFGAATAAAKLLGLDAEGIRNALGLVSSYASGLAQFFVSGSDVKRLHAGKASAGGLECALLARAGLTGPPDAIEGAQGFGQAFSDSFDPAVIERDLGRHFWLTSISLKVHAGTVRLQAAIEAAEMLSRQGVRMADIAAVEIGVPQLLIGKLTWNEPVDHQQAQMSAPFAVALAFARAPERPGLMVLDVDDFGTGMTEPDIRALSARTVCVFDAEIDAGMTREHVPARVTVTLNDGTRHEAKVMIPKGCPSRPITRDEVVERFRLAAGGRLAPATLDAWLAHAAAPQEIASVRDFLSITNRTG